MAARFSYYMAQQCGANGALLAELLDAPSREKLYWRGCLPARALIAACVLVASIFLAADSIVASIFLCTLAIIAVHAVYNNLLVVANPGCRWWDSRRSVAAAGVIAAAAAFGYAGKLSMPAVGGITAAMLVLHGALGALEATQKCPWRESSARN